MSLFNKIKSVFNSSSDDVPDAQTIYFKNGEMYKVFLPFYLPVWYKSYKAFLHDCCPVPLHTQQVSGLYRFLLFE